MRPSNESLLASFIADLEIEMKCNAEEKARGRTDLDDYDAKCRSQLERLRNAEYVRFDRYGWPIVGGERL